MFIVSISPYNVVFDWSLFYVLILKPQLTEKSKKQIILWRKQVVK
jgi:hypothetical protein